MKSWFLKIAAIGMVLLPLHCLAADDRGTSEDAQAMVKRAIEFYKANHLTKAVVEFSKADGKFADRGLHVTVYSLEGLCLASVDPRAVGRNMIDVRDGDGKYFVRERLEASLTRESGWQEPRFYNPVSKKIESERQYWETFDGLVFATGARKS